MVAVLTDRRSTTLVAVVASAIVLADTHTITLTTQGALAAVRTDRSAPTITTLLATTVVRALPSLAPRFAGDAPLASMAVTVDLELRFDSAALALGTDEELSALHVVGCHTE